MPATKRRAPSPSPLPASSSYRGPLLSAESADHPQLTKVHIERDRMSRQQLQEPESNSRPHGRLLHVSSGVLSTRRLAGPHLTDEPDEINQRSVPHSLSRSHSHVHREHPGNQQRQLFDPRKDDPVRFQTSVFNRSAPISKSSVDTVVSASSTSASSYAHSIGSSFTLTSNSTGTSGTSSGNPNVPREESESGNAFVSQLKKLYREITSLEGKLVTEDPERDDDEEPRFTLQARTNSIDTVSDDKYLKMISDHKW
jgi:protein SMG6